MKKVVGLVLLCLGNLCMAQNTLTAVVKDASTQAVLAGATAFLSGTPTGAIADSNGIVFLSNIANGKQVLVVQFTGYKEHRETLDFPRSGDTFTVLLEADSEAMEQVIISATRSGRTLQNTPTRVELIEGEELEEKGNMKPGDIRMMLNESTGIQTQQVSATSANASIRIQGLDGRYTQLLKDGFPLYAGLSGGLGLLQTPPLDLKQVEVIKGASSTLYGGGAIAGLVNLVSKIPTAERELKWLVNGTSAGGLDVNGFYSQQWKQAGITLFASRNSSKAYDPSGTGFTAIPQTQRYVLNPTLFLRLHPKVKMQIGVNGAVEDRMGGDINVIKGNGDSIHRYVEQNKSSRFSTRFLLEHRWTEHSGLTVKNSVNYFGRTITIPGYVFDGKQWSTYSEITYHQNRGKTGWVAGLNAYTDHFKEHPKDGFLKRDYTQNTVGGFVQNTWKAASWIQTETGVRTDCIADYGWVVLPRVAALFDLSPRLTSRIGGGLGYKTPSIFTEETERIQFQSVLPVNAKTNQLEKSYGANVDLNYRASLLNKIQLTIHQLFFYTRLHHPLQLSAIDTNQYRLINTKGYADTKGWETNVKMSYKNIQLLIGYTFTDAQLNEGGIRKNNPLTAKHRLNNVLMYETANKWKLGLEAYYYSKQYLADGTTGSSFWTCGLMAEKWWRHFALFINFENLTDTRQTKFDRIYTGTVTQPLFKDIYAPLDGFVANGGVKLDW